MLKNFIPKCPKDIEIKMIFHRNSNVSKASKKLENHPNPCDILQKFKRFFFYLAIRRCRKLFLRIQENNQKSLRALGPNHKISCIHKITLPVA